MNTINALLILLIIPALFAIIKNILRNTLVWQEKEYRFDRLSSYLKYEKDYKDSRMAIWYVKIALATVLIIYLLVPYNTALLIAAVITFVIYLLELQYFFTDLFLKRFSRPKIKSTRNLMIFSATFLVIFLIVVIYFLFINTQLESLFNFDKINQNPPNIDDILNPQPESPVPLMNILVATTTLLAITLDFLAPFLVSLFVMVTHPLAKIKRRRVINRAKNHLNQIGYNPKIIAVTGSYGKTTTKDLIASILSLKYKVAKSDDNQNTTVGLAYSILKNVTKETEYFVAEMGAYTKGEITESTDLVPPDISIVTAVNQQHVSLFGSIENLIKAKSEIIKGSKQKAVIILNGKDEACLAMSRTTDKDTVFFNVNVSQLSMKNTPNTENEEVVKNSVPSNRDWYANILSTNDSTTEIEILHENSSHKVTLKIPNPYYANNVLAAIVACVNAGMDTMEVIEALKEVDLGIDYFNEIKGENDSTILDDGKSSNLTGFTTALKYLDMKKDYKKRWVFTQGIIELGAEQKPVYKELAPLIISSADVMVTNDKGLINAVENCQDEIPIIKVKSTYDFINTYKFKVSPGDLVLIEGSFSNNFYKAITSKNEN